MTRKEEIEKEAIKQCTFKVKGIDDYIDTIDNTQYKGFIAGAQWADETMIEKAIGWIDYHNRNGGCNIDEWEKDFKKAMMEE